MPRAQGNVVDPCAERLHDLCEPLLVFAAMHQRLPDSLDEFKAASPDMPPLVCPTSGLPYVWRPADVYAPKGEVLLADAKPVHNGKRWAILIEPGNKGKLMLRVSQI